MEYESSNTLPFSLLSQLKDIQEERSSIFHKQNRKSKHEKVPLTGFTHTQTSRENTTPPP